MLGDAVAAAPGQVNGVSVSKYVGHERQDIQIVQYLFNFLLSLVIRALIDFGSDIPWEKTRQFTIIASFQHMKHSTAHV